MNRFGSWDDFVKVRQDPSYNRDGCGTSTRSVGSRPSPFTGESGDLGVHDHDRHGCREGGDGVPVLLRRRIRSPVSAGVRDNILTFLSGGSSGGRTCDVRRRTRRDYLRAMSRRCQLGSLPSHVHTVSPVRYLELGTERSPRSLLSPDTSGPSS